MTYKTFHTYVSKRVLFIMWKCPRRKLIRPLPKQIENQRPFQRRLHHRQLIGTCIIFRNLVRLVPIFTA